MKSPSQGHPFGTAGSAVSEWQMFDADLGVIRDCTPAELFEVTELVKASEQVRDNLSNNTPAPVYSTSWDDNEASRVIDLLAGRNPNRK